jgi:TolB-like protein
MTDTPFVRAPFRVLIRRRNAYAHQQLVDVQLQHVADGALIWSQTFSDDTQADTFADTVRDDLTKLADPVFRKKYAVPSQL